MTLPDWTLLLQQARSGSTEAVERLLAPFRPYLWVVARHEIDPLLQAKTGGSDLVQESLLHAFRNLHTFQGDSEGEFRRWLLAILRNAHANHRRAQSTQKRDMRREQSLEADSSFGGRDALPDDGEAASQIAMRKEERQRVREMIEQLKPRYQHVLRLRSEERQTFEEIARELSITPDGARMLWGRALRKLKELLGEERE